MASVVIPKEVIKVWKGSLTVKTATRRDVAAAEKHGVASRGAKSVPANPTAKEFETGTDVT